MKASRFRKSYRRTASSLHRVVGRALRFQDGPFANHKIYQEYPVCRVNTQYENTRHKFDWVVLDLKLVIECHGKQHYEPIAHFLQDGLSFLERKKVDRRKQLAAEAVGFTYVVVPYFSEENVTPEWLWDRYLHNFNDLSPVTPVKKPESVYKQKMKERAREYRKARYEQQKLWKREVSNGVQASRHQEDDT
jgi:very-short-patch-repair endonuclease